MVGQVAVPDHPPAISATTSSIVRLRPRAAAAAKTACGSRVSSSRRRASRSDRRCRSRSDEKTGVTG